MSTQHREAKMLRDILVVKSSVLYTDETPWGFVPAADVEWEDQAIQHYEYKMRWDMEEDLNYQQPIPYVIVHNPELDKFVAYKRGSSESTSGEQRLYGKWSLWVGWHIERDQESDANPIRSTAIIEIEEEIGLSDIENLTLLWYIRDKTVPVNLYHLGMVYVATTHTPDVETVDGELEQVYFKSADEIDELMNSPEVDMESRSRIARDAYKASL